jgi:3-hydroxyisobutyrate dehydrogenase
MPHDQTSDRRATRLVKDHEFETPLTVSESPAQSLRIPVQVGSDDFLGSSSIEAIALSGPLEGRRRPPGSADAPPPASRRVGVVGTGRMGLPVCARLAQKGFGVLATDVRPQAQAPVVAAGARWAASLAEVVSGCEVLITVLPGPGEVMAVLDSAMSGLAPGSTWIDMSTATPDTAAAIASAADLRGLRVLDAPVGGGPPEARSGRLVAFVGGAGDVLASQRDVFDALAERVVHVGPAGSGYTVKLLVNLLWFGQAVAGAEVLSLAAKAGLDPETMRLAVQGSASANRFMEEGATALLRGDDLTSFSLVRCHEELAAALAMGEHLGVPLALADRVTELYGQALEHYGDIDGELLAARLVTERAGVTLGKASGRLPE